MNRHYPHALLINPWIVDFAAYDFWIKPLGLLTIGSALRQQGYRITLLDCLDRFHPILSKNISNDTNDHRFFGTGHYHKEILIKPPVLSHVPRKYGRYGMPYTCVRELLAGVKTPDIICMTSGMTYWYPGVFDMIALCREYFPEVPIILGGIYATLCTDHAKANSGADYVFKGQSLKEVLALTESISGHCSQKYDDHPVWPAYDLYPNLQSAAIRTATGCPFQCPFCASHLLSPEFSRRDPKDVANEIVSLTQELGVQDVAFYDDALLVDADRHLIPILNYLMEGNTHVSLHTPNGLHPRWIDPELARFMRISGFKTVRLSFESINPDRQQAMGQKVTDSDLENAVIHLKSAGFTAEELGSYIIMGLPNQTFQEIVDSLLFIYHLGIRVSLASFSPIPGTESWKEAVALSLIADDCDPLLTNNSIFPLVPDSHEKKRLTLLSTYTAQANQMMIRGESPLLNKPWREAIESLGRS